MRRPPWLAACLLVVSCTVNTANLDVAADGAVPGSGGNTPGSGGATATGGTGGDDCPRCAPTGGTIGTGGQIATGGTLGTGGRAATGGHPGGGSGGPAATGGQTGAGGQMTTGGGGQTATGGQPGSGGQTAAGGQPGSGGQTATGGQPGTGGQIGAGGQMSTGGKSGTGGAPGQSCAQIESAYATALTAAKDCTVGAGLQCRLLADTSIACPGCKVYVNDTTELASLKAQWTSAGCALSRGVCPAIACVVPSPASCVSSSATRPTIGPNTAGTCTSPPYGGGPYGN